MNTLALYMRASQEDINLGESATIQNQRDLLYHYIQNHQDFSHWNVMEFQDDGWSGTNFDRPGVQKMLKLAGKDVRCIIVKDFSRFGRNLIEVGNYLDQIFPFLGVRFIAVNEGYDSNAMNGRTIGLDVSLKAMVYEMYSRDLSVKISSVKQAQMRQGQYIGRYAFYGYQKSMEEKNKLVIDEDAAAIVKRIFSLASDGKKPSEIAVILNEQSILPPAMYQRVKHPEISQKFSQLSKCTIWTAAIVKRIIQDERYTGCLIGHKRARIDISQKQTKLVPKDQWIKSDNAHEPVISKEIYQQAQAVLESRKSGKQMKCPSELFRGILKCGCCGRILRKMPGGNAPYFKCISGKYAPSLPCAELSVGKAQLEQIVLSALKAEVRLILHKPVPASRCVKTAPNQFERLQRQIEKLKSEQFILFEQFSDGKLSKASYLAQKKAISERMEAISTQMERAAQKNESDMQLCPADFGEYACMQSLTHEMLAALIQKITVDADNAVHIVWNFSPPCFDAER